MPAFTADRRDIDFVLFDQFGLGELAQLEAFREFGEDDFRAILDAAMKLTVEVLAPSNISADREGCRLEDGAVRVPEAFQQPWKEFSEGGWIAPSRPSEVGGMGLPLPLSVIATELTIGAACSFVFFPGLCAAAGHLLEAFADPEFRDLVVPRMYSGQWTGTMCLTEPQAGSTVGDLTTTATPIEGADEYSIQGNKIFISGGDHDLTENIIHLVLARVAGDPSGTKGISLFAVPKRRFDAAGKLGEVNDVAVTAIEEKMGIHGSPTCALSFGENGDCRGYLIGKRCEGIIYMFQMMNEARIICGVQGAAAANTAYQYALAFAKDRVQGPSFTENTGESVPIINHPDVRRNLMLSKAWAEGLRSMLVQTAMYATYAEHHPDEAERERNQALVDLMTPICKAYATDMGFKVTELAVQIHGGYGYIREYGVEQLLRDVKIASIYEGTNGIQAMDLLGRKMRMRDGALFATWMADADKFFAKHGEHPRLGELLATANKAKNALANTAMGLAAQSGESISLAMLSATPFLEMFGHVETARLWCHQAVVADSKLQDLLRGNEETDLNVLVASNEEARFLDAKVKTARFFVHQILPHAIALAKTIDSRDTSALDVAL